MCFVRVIVLVQKRNVWELQICSRVEISNLHLGLFLRVVALLGLLNPLHLWLRFNILFANDPHTFYRSKAKHFIKQYMHLRMCEGRETDRSFFHFTSFSYSSSIVIIMWLFFVIIILLRIFVKTVFFVPLCILMQLEHFTFFFTCCKKTLALIRMRRNCIGVTVDPRYQLLGQF